MTTSYWLRPGQELLPDLEDRAALDDFFAALEKQFPPPNPLDDEAVDDDMD